MQRAAEGDVQLLDAAADRQDRHAARDRGADQRQRGGVARGVVQVGRLAVATFIVAGVDVARAARDQQAVEAVEHGQFRLAQRGDHDGDRAGAAQHVHRLFQTVGAVVQYDERPAPARAVRAEEPAG